MVTVLYCFPGALDDIARRPAITVTALAVLPTNQRDENDIRETMQQ